MSLALTARAYVPDTLRMTSIGGDVFHPLALNLSFQFNSQRIREVCEAVGDDVSFSLQGQFFELGASKYVDLSTRGDQQRAN